MMGSIAELFMTDNLKNQNRNTGQSMCLYGQLKCNITLVIRLLLPRRVLLRRTNNVKILSVRDANILVCAVRALEDVPCLAGIPVKRSKVSLERK